MTTLLELGNESFVSLTTFRKTGARVSTPVWIAREGETLVVTTPSASGKVKRLRNSSRVELQACSRMGTVVEGSPVISAVAEIVEGPTAEKHIANVMRHKYRFEYRLTLLIERIVKRGAEERVMLRITES